MPDLRLRRGEERRIVQGHPWIFSNEVDVAVTPLRAFSPGDLVCVSDCRGSRLGVAYVNPGSLIAGRILCPREDDLDPSFFRNRIRDALTLRERLFPQRPFYRLIYGESDGLPGLVVDRFGDVLVLQITTAGMERLRDAVVAALGEVLQPRVIIERSDGSLRDLEGLAPVKHVLQGELADAGWTELEENGVRFVAPLLQGQKTGWFYDHRSARARLPLYVHGKSVLDVFSYLGAWGIQAAAHGARSVTCVDSSEFALAGVRQNGELNTVSDRVETIAGDALKVLAGLAAAGRTFDVLIVDPPAFIKRKKDHKDGFQAYARVNELALRVLAPGGILISASCSFHLKRDELLAAINQGNRRTQRALRILEEHHQGPDHPIHPLIPEMAYLKAFIISA